MTDEPEMESVDVPDGFEDDAGIGAVDWRTLSGHDKNTVEADLSEWVGWLVYRYALDDRQVPACWRGHGPLVEELSALWSAWVVAFDPMDTGYGPIGWHERFELMLGRVKNRWYGGECARTHEPVRAGRPRREGALPDWHSPQQEEGAEHV